MKRFASLLLALGSAVAAASGLQAARPHYGGALRVETAGTIRQLDPAATATDPSDQWTRDRILPLVFEGLTRVDADGGLTPQLAASWQPDPGLRRWRIRIAPGVALHDGSVLQTDRVAASLQAVEPHWRIGADRETLLIDLPEPLPDLPWVLADTAHLIVVRTIGGLPIGSGPFRLERHEGAQLSLRAHEDYRSGRPFLDDVRIQMGQSFAAQLADFEGGRADFVSVLPMESRRLAQRGVQLFESRPIELIAIVFESHRAAAAFDSVRRSVADAIDRSRIADVLLQQRAAPADALLPAWLSGYHVRSGDAAGATHPATVRPPDETPLTLRFDGTDPVARAVAERVGVDLRAAGLTVALQSPSGLAPRPDMRLVRVRLPVTTPERAWAELVDALGPGVSGDAGRRAPRFGFALDTVYESERQLLDRNVIVPLVHLADVSAVAPEIATWRSRAVLGSGAWALDDLWIRTPRLRSGQALRLRSGQALRLRSGQALRLRSGQAPRP